MTPVSQGSLGNGTFLNALANFIATCLEYIYQFTVTLHIPSYALAIILLTLALKLILFPLTLKQNRSMRDMQRVQPLLNDINRRYANNPEMKNTAMMKVYKEYHINPMAGCLPLLIQMPILIGLFQALRTFVPSNPADYVLFSSFWITDLSAADPTKIIMPILVGGSTFLQSYLSVGKPEQTAQKVMLYAMPLMMAYWAMTFPAALCIYWIFYGLFSMIERIFVNGGLKPAPIESLKEETAAKGEKNK